MTAQEIPGTGKALFTLQARGTQRIAEKTTESTNHGDMVILQKQEGPGENLIPKSLNFGEAPETGEKSASASDTAREASSLPFLLKVGTGAMLGLTIFSALSAALPGSGPVLPPSASHSPAITRLIDMAEGDFASPAAESDRGAPSFPGKLNLDTESTQNTAPVESPQEQGTNFRQYDNIEPLNALRIEIFRDLLPKEARTDSKETRQKELSPFGIEIGDGFFYDINGNLTFNPLRVDGEFSSIRIDPHSLPKSTMITKEGDRISIIPHGAVMQDRTIISRDAQKLRIKLPRTINPIVIEQEEGRTKIQTPGHLGLLETTSITQMDDMVRYDPPDRSFSVYITQKGNDLRINDTRSGEDITISRDDDMVKIKYPDIGKDTKITKSGGQTIIEPGGLGNTITLTREGDTVTVHRFGWPKSIDITVNR